MALELVKRTAMDVNAFTLNNRVLEFLTPLKLIKNTQLDFNKYFQVIFGEYVHKFEGSN